MSLQDIIDAPQKKSYLTIKLSQDGKDQGFVRLHAQVVDETDVPDKMIVRIAKVVANDCKSLSIGFNLDLYVKMSFGELWSGKTPYKKNVLSGEWPIEPDDSSMRFEVTHGNLQSLDMVVSVYDRDMVSHDELVGEDKKSLSLLLQEPLGSICEFVFEVKNDYGERTGEVILQIQMTSADHAAPRHMSTAINDSAKGGIDRFGYGYYAKSLVKVLRNASPPMCVGLYAKWGSGKSFMIHLLKKEFDPFIFEDSNTHELYQWFQRDFSSDDQEAQQPSRYHSVNSKFCTRLRHRLMMLMRCIKRIVVPSVPKSMYSLRTISSVYLDILRDMGVFISNQMLEFYHGKSEYEEVDTMDKDPEIGDDLSDMLHEEIIFVDFNAWEYCRSSELWTGLIKNLYNEVELRMNKQKYYYDKSPYARQSMRKDADDQNAANENTKRKPGSLCSLFFCFLRSSSVSPSEVGDDSSDNNNADLGLVRKLKKISVDYKELWRVETAKRKLVEDFGERGLHVLVFFALVFAIGLPTLVVLSFTILYSFWSNVKATASSFVPLIFSLMIVLGTLVPFMRLLKHTSDNANQSQGDKFYEEGNGAIRDNIGFMSRVKSELNHLFQFIAKFTEETGIKLKLVLFVDDLDRCFGDRCVKVLEAVQLVLALSGLPVIVFLAVDSRVVVASVESSINRDLIISDAMITGFEYMDKIVQLPFCIPDVSCTKLGELIRAYSQSSADSIELDLTTRLKALQDEFSAKNLTASYVVKFQGEYTDPLERFHKLLTTIRALPRSNNKSSLKAEELIMACGQNIMNENTIRAVEMVRHKNPVGREYLYQLIKGYLSEVECIRSLNEHNLLLDRNLLGHNERVCATCISGNESLIISCSDDKHVRIWDKYSGECEVVLEGHTEGVCVVTCFSVDEKLHIVSGGLDATVRVWTVDPSKCLLKLQGHTSAVTAICGSKAVVVSGSNDNTIKIWKMPSGDCINTLDVHASPIRLLFFSSNGQVISGDLQGAIRIWDVDAKDRSRIRNSYQSKFGSMDGVNSVSICVTSNSNHFVFLKENGTVKVINQRIGAAHFLMIKGDEKVTATCISKDDRYVVCGQSDGHLSVWDIGTGVCLRTISGAHSSCVSSVSTTWNSGHIISGSDDGSIKITSMREMPKLGKNERIIIVRNGSVVGDDGRPIEDKQSEKTIVAHGNTDVIDESNSRSSDHRLSFFPTPVYSSKLDSDNAASLPQFLEQPVFRVLERTDANPRRIKRILNVILLIIQIGESKPLGEEMDPSYSEENKISSHENWHMFLRKVVKWVILCECFPYRMSFLVHCLHDIEQKHLYNKSKRPGSSLHYNEIASFTDVMNQSIVVFFNEHVEKYLHAIPSVAKFERLDGDGDLFNYTMEVCSGENDMSIYGRDIFGMTFDESKSEFVEVTNLDFSLLRYSFNLIPSIRKQIGVEMNTIMTGSELHLCNHEDSCKNGLMKENASTLDEEEASLPDCRIHHVMKLANDGYVVSRKQYHDFTMKVN